MRERPISAVPKFALVLLVLAFACQVAWHFRQPAPQAKAEDLVSPPSISALRIASFGDPVALAKTLMLYVQAFDNQSGVNLPFQRLDYTKVQEWLSRILLLDPSAQYPLFAASRLYGEINDDAKQRAMLEFVYREFLVDPNRRWKSLAHATVLAKHRLKDLPLARKYAQAIRVYATGSDVPHWARQMEIFVLEDMDELQSAKILIGGMLNSGEITDPHEIRFLEQRLVELESRAKNRQ